MGSTVIQARPDTAQEAARLLAQASREGRTVRLLGGQTKSGWGCVTAEADLELATGGLGEITEHNRGDLTAVLEAGVPFAAAQAQFAQAGQMLALDPPLGAGNAATIGGIVATADSGPLRHRYGGPRDLVIGVTVALADGTIAKSGGKVIKNVAGYDLAKLYAGSFGTLGLILSVSVRLHPRPDGGTTALGAATDPDALARAAVAMARMPLEFEALDVAWRGGRGGLLLRCAGREHARRAGRAGARLAELGLDGVDTTEDDAGLWERQRAGQRSPQAALVRIVAPPAALAPVLRAADAVDGTLVGRAALGIGYVALAPGRIAELRAALPPGAIGTVLDAPAGTRSDASLWGETSPRALTLMRAVKAGFDPTRTLNPGLFVGGI